MTRSVRQLLVPLTIVGVVYSSVRCGDDGGGGAGPGAGTPANLTIVSGNNQQASPNQALPSALVVRVTDAASNPVGGVSVTWAVTLGGGSVSPTSSTSGSDGTASTTLTLGPGTGANTVTASVAGVSPATFTATATTGGGGGGGPPLSATVAIVDFDFQPTSVTIAVNGTVTWNWTGIATHNVTFATDVTAANDTSVTQTSGMFALTFPNTGTFNYQCTIHPTLMNATVTVQ